MISARLAYQLTYPKLGIDTRCVRGTRRVGDHARMPAQRLASAPRRAAPGTSRKIRDRAAIARSEGTTGARKSPCRVGEEQGGVADEHRVSCRGSGDSHMLGSAETSQRLACDASRVVMRHTADGRVEEVGARTRTIPPALRRVLHHRDKGCRFPGCGRPFGQGHHIRHWAHGGPTTLSNLALLCRRHHRAVHEEGYQVERLPDGELEFRRPDGRSLPDVPSQPSVAHDPVHALRARHESQGLWIHARTAMPGWLGERLDVGWAIDVLHPLAVRTRSE